MKPAMQSTGYPRRTMLPPKGRPVWQPRDPGRAELRFLSWGLRWFGDHPIPPAMHDGWVYALIVEGAPRLVVKGRPRATRAGTVFVLHPDCAYGWTDAPGACCRIVSWVWRSAPGAASLVPDSGGYRRFVLERADVARLLAVWAACRDAVAVRGELGDLLVRRARLDLDVRMLQALNPGRAAEGGGRMTQALQYLRHHPAQLQPVRGLAEHLQLSPSGVKRLFGKRFGRSPRAVALEMRMDQARRWIAGGRAVKEIAYDLGYRHPNDLSRAFRRHFGVTAREVAGRRGSS